MQDFLLILLIVFAGFILITLVRAAFYKPKKRDTTPLPPKRWMWTDMSGIYPTQLR